MNCCGSLLLLPILLYTTPCTWMASAFHNYPDYHCVSASCSHPELCKSGTMMRMPLGVIEAVSHAQLRRRHARDKHVRGRHAPRTAPAHSCQHPIALMAATVGCQHPIALMAATVGCQLVSMGHTGRCYCHAQIPTLHILKMQGRAAHMSDQPVFTCRQDRTIQCTAANTVHVISH